MPNGIARLASSIRLRALAVSLMLLAAQLASANETVAEVVGVVTAMGSGGSAEDDDEWSLSFSLRPWRVVGGPQNSHELRLRREGLNENDLREQMDLYVANAIVRVRVRFRVADATTPGSLPTDADLLEYVGRESNDRGMTDWVAQRMRPVVIKDSMLGALTLDRVANAYEGERKYRDKRYRLYIDRGSDDDDAQRDRALIEARRAVVRKVEAAVPAYLEAAADELLDLYNETWRGTGPAIDRKAFMQRLTLDSLSIDEDGAWTVYFEDGGLFLGHAIQVSVESDGEVADIDLAG